MKSLILYCGLSALLPKVLVNAAFGNSFSSGPTASGNFIRVANSTLIVPSSPSPQVGLMSLWMGMGTDAGDLIQALTESYYGTAGNAYCGALNGSWCSYASTLENSNGQGQIGGAMAFTLVGDEVTVSYIYNDDQGYYDQSVYINGVLGSNMTTPPGKGIGWGTAEECQPEYPCGLVPAHEWVDTVLVLDQAQPDYNATFGTTGATGTLTTTDGGITWSSCSISIDELDWTFIIPSSISDASACPANNGSTYSSGAVGSGTTYNITCGFDYPGGTLSTVDVASTVIADCLPICEQQTGCVGAVMNGSTCYLKEAFGNADTSDGFSAAILLPGVYNDS